ncbi:LacI family DNA-binding transcriptional regulator [Ruania halotolerans]|uniref:LacI family DNA-binding transcriptional regulator n=1 Tax=Ruania halotolerans TaxID=2897773 RepID=UPI001E2EB90E|nr:LacI family DNA-binding transcriptional regulator [Ruania halotolerans]UFU06954.1 LacI family transcriptional regulator [Ruania halotolerans]
MGAGIDDVARAAGVSTATVSRALRGLPNVREETRTKVLRVASQLNYAPSPSAASLASGRTRTIGLLTPSFSRWFHRNVVEGAERTLRSAGFDVLLHAFDVGSDMTRRMIDTGLLRRRVDGVLVLGLPLAATEIMDLDRLDLPLVFIGAGSPQHVRVHMDDRACSTLAVEHLVALGHRTIGQIHASAADTSRWSPARERADAAAESLAAAGIENDPSLVEYGDFTHEGGRGAAARLLDARPDITAVYAHSDEMAFGALEVLRDRGLRVPEEISVIGVDGHELNELVGLSSVAQDAQAQGEAGATLILEMLTGAPVGSDVLFPVSLEPRRSTGPVPG